MAAKSIVIGIAGAALGLAAAIALLPDVRERLLPSVGQQVTGKALIGGAFTLTDNTGKRVTDQDFHGKYTLVFFGFTSCPDICPAGLQLIAGALEKLGAKAQRITPIFISVDPQRDTPEQLAAYVKNFDPSSSASPERRRRSPRSLKPTRSITPRCRAKSAPTITRWTTRRSST